MSGRDVAILVISTIIGTGGLGGLGMWILGWRKDRRQAPIERQQAETAETLSHVDAADSLVTQALALAKAASEQANRAETEAKAARREAQKGSLRITALEREVDTLRRALTAARQYVVILLEEWRRLLPDVPVPPPPPDYLHD